MKVISVPRNISRATSAAPSWRASVQRSRGAVEQLAGRFKHGGIQRLLHHAGGLDAQNLKGGGSIRRADVTGAFATPDGGRRPQAVRRRR